MNSRASSLFGLVAACVAGLLSTPVHAQTTTTTTGATIGPSAQAFPERFVDGQDKGQSERPQNLTPLGVNFDDCIRDMTLEFRALVTLPGTDTVQIWASNAADCTTASARGAGGIAPTCWRLNGGLGGAQVLTAQAKSFDVRVQDIVGGQSLVSNAIATQPVSFGAEACTLQPSFAATTFNVFIMAIQSDNVTFDGGWKYPLPVDMLGPNPPTINTPGIGHTLLTVTWTPNTDSDTGGYDVFVDPPPSSVGADAALTTTTCDDSGVCQTVTSAPSTSCGSPALSSGSIVSDAGTSISATTTTITSTSTSTSTSASTVLLGATTSTTTTSSSVAGAGGVATVPCDFLVGTSCPAGQPAYTATHASVAGESSGNFNVTGLVDGVNYNVAVAAVDNFGNVGPLSTVQCQIPQQVTDFFQSYRDAGGSAGGGFCSVDAVGHSATWGAVGCAAAVGILGSGRRRRRGRARAADRV
jgi:hypothetical protein